jgi:hypothetical protein
MIPSSDSKAVCRPRNADRKTAPDGEGIAATAEHIEDLARCYGVESTGRGRVRRRRARRRSIDVKR